MSERSQIRFMEMILQWIRTDDNDYARGYTAGYLSMRELDLDPWQNAHIRNILNARNRGVAA